MDINGKPDHIEDYLGTINIGYGGWFGWSNSKNKVYANLIIHDDSKSKPSESDCTTGLATLQSDYDAAEVARKANVASAKTKLQNLGLTVDEVKDAFNI